MLGQPEEMGWAKWQTKRGLTHATLLKRAGGQAMAVPCMASVLISFYFNPHAGWWSPQEESDQCPPDSLTESEESEGESLRVESLTYPNPIRKSIVKQVRPLTQ